MRIFKKTLAAFVGILYCICILTFLALSIPVYLYRLLIIFLAKRFRQDLGDILSGQSAIFVGDYMLKTTPPRSMIVIAALFEGQLTIEEVRARVVKNWIHVGENRHLENFQRYPVKWLGFTFWKKASDSFAVDRHVLCHESSRGGKQVTDKQLNNIMEKLLNERTPQNQSPWTLQLIENYENPCAEADSSDGTRKQHSALIFHCHHCLVDGVGIITASVETLFEQTWIRKSSIQSQPTTNTWSNVLHNYLTIPINIISQLSWFLSHAFRKNPFKIPDNKKLWHQVCVRSGPISIERIKTIKNAVGVSFTSVLLSTISAAVNKALGDDQAEKTKSVLCMSVLPSRKTKNRKILSNHMTGAPLELPCIKFENPIERLRIINQLLERSRSSIVPSLSETVATLIGAHTYVVNHFLMDNKMIAISLTNFAGVPNDIVLTENTKWIRTRSIVGSFRGDQGMQVSMVSHGQQMEMVVCAERALMSREQAELFAQHINDELENLESLIAEHASFGKVENI